MGDVKSQDALIIGGGLTGLATAFQLLRALPDARVTILEREGRLACHQSGRTPGVLATGLGCRGHQLSFAMFREGRRALEQFCLEQDVPWRRSGELVLARGGEEGWLRRHHTWAGDAGIEAEWWSAEQLREFAPGVAGSSALCLPDTGLIDYQLVCERLAGEIHARGGLFVGGAEVQSLSEAMGLVRVESLAGDFEASVLVNCAGLEAGRLARLSGADPGLSILPFLAEYQELDAEGRGLVGWPMRTVPRPGAMFGPVRLIPTVDGRVECGPNLVPCWNPGVGSGRRKTGRGMAGWIGAPGWWPMILREWRFMGRRQWLSWSRRAFADEARELLPGLKDYHFDAAKPGICGVALRPDGTFETDLQVVRNGRFIHACNIPEAGATAALAIGRMLANQGLGFLV